ncbi:hypothetical protein V8F06_008371 [Rhypophila decipiens]
MQHGSAVVLISCSTASLNRSRRLFSALLFVSFLAREVSATIPMLDKSTISFCLVYPLGFYLPASSNAVNSKGRVAIGIGRRTLWPTWGCLAFLLIASISQGRVCCDVGLLEDEAGCGG